MDIHHVTPTENDHIKDQPKNPYATPHILVHGNVEEITRAFNPGNTDPAMTGSF